VRLKQAFATDASRRKLAIGLALFSALVTIPALISLIAFDSAPGRELATPFDWPVTSGVPRAAERANLLVFVHPFCGCTTATITELSRLAATRQGAVPPVTTFLVYRPSQDSTWKWRDFQAARRSFPSATFRWDDGGTEARRFHATTSGTVLYYGSGGTLQFHGGVTGSRGHEGDNYGLSALEKAMDTKIGGSLPSSSRVFGCALGAPATGEAL
jgi:hypothetical protein